MRTERYGSWQEYASFVLGTNDGGWHIVGFTDPLASELVPLLRALPDFDDQLLLELIGTRTQRLTILWRVSVGLP
ncbi:MAG: hypothetical protein JO100_10230 [Pseudonocardia sp.]|nr:hypothetical protein [Pseudonocardia sp.]